MDNLSFLGMIQKYFLKRAGYIICRCEDPALIFSLLVCMFSLVSLSKLLAPALINTDKIKIDFYQWTVYA